jgi:hypothetical protein
MNFRYRLAALIIALGLCLEAGAAQQLLENLGKRQDFRSRRISSFDRSGGNNDRIAIPPGETAELAKIKGPAAIHHIWVTISAEAFYGRKIVLRMYWDGEDNPSVEAPIGDFFGVGHGLNRNLSSLAIACSSEGRARNCYWYMPFRRSARITATNEGQNPVGAFYYYIDYRELPELEAGIPYFHAQYRQEMPCIPGKNYLILEAAGSGHYVGCNLSILQRAMGWWGEGDDMIYVDGEEFPSLYGTGSEDYFSDAWGMREDENLFYGCPLQEPDFKTGSKATVYRHHIPDPIPFEESIKVTIEHGHANNLSDFYSSVAYWYQNEPHKAFPAHPPVDQRLPFALESPGFAFPDWEGMEPEQGAVSFEDETSGMTVSARRLTHALTSFYGPQGNRYPVLSTDGAREGDRISVSLDTPVGEYYDVTLFYLGGPSRGKVQAKEVRAGGQTRGLTTPQIEGYSRQPKITQIRIPDVRLSEGLNTLIFEVSGKHSEASAAEFGFVGMALKPCRPHFVREWNLLGPFEAPDMSYLQAVFPPEQELDLSKTYPGKGDRRIGWSPTTAPESGWVRLEDLITPKEQVVAYGLAYVHAEEARETQLLIGSDDGVRIWLNGRLVHTNPAYRGAYPDQDRIRVSLSRGWNSLLIKVLPGAGGWGYYVRFADPEHSLIYSRDRRK